MHRNRLTGRRGGDGGTGLILPPPVAKISNRVRAEIRVRVHPEESVEPGKGEIPVPLRHPVPESEGLFPTPLPAVSIPELFKALRRPGTGGQ